MSRVDTWKFPGGPVIRIQLWLWIIPLVKELRSCKPCSMAKKKKKKKSYFLNMWMESGKILLLSARHMAARDGEVSYRPIPGQAAQRSELAVSPGPGEQCF